MGQTKTQQDDKGEWAGRREGDLTPHQRSKGKRALKKKKSVLNVPRKSRAEQHPLGLTVLSSSMSNSGGVSREQSPDQDVWGAGYAEKKANNKWRQAFRKLAVMGREKEEDG